MTTTSAATPARPLVLHQFRLSGHCHRVELFLSLLGLPYARVDVDLPNRAHKAPDFLRMNAFGQIPVLEDGDVTLADSNAILVYLASRYDKDARWLPKDPVKAAMVQRWLSVAAGQLASGPAAARLVTLFGAPHNAAELIARSNALFAVMETELGNRSFLAGADPTLADVANYSYTALAPEGNVDLAPYPNLRAWLARIEDLPGFLPPPRSRVGLAA